VPVLKLSLQMSSLVHAFRLTGRRGGGGGGWVGGGGGCASVAFYALSFLFVALVMISNANRNHYHGNSYCHVL
jgi:hypothetical protein